MSKEEKATAKKRYFKLGDKATTFVDPKSGLKVIGPEVVEVSHKKVKNSQAVTQAKAGGHIVETDEDEFHEWKGIEKATNKKAAKAKETAKEEAADTSTTATDDDDEDQLQDQDLSSGKASKKKSGKKSK